jgi:hypothetical protein
MRAPSPEDRARAARVGPKVDLLDVRLVAVRSELHAVVHDTLLDAEVEFDVSVNAQGQVALYNVHAHAELSAASDAERTDDREDGLPEGLVFSADVNFLLVYEVQGQQPLEAEDLEAFGNVSALFAAYPYLREQLQSLTVRSGLPPLTIGVYRLPVSGTGGLGPTSPTTD